MPPAQLLADSPALPCQSGEPAGGGRHLPFCDVELGLGGLWGLREGSYGPEGSVPVLGYVHAAFQNLP